MAGTCTYNKEQALRQKEGRHTAYSANPGHAFPGRCAEDIMDNLKKAMAWNQIREMKRHICCSFWHNSLPLCDLTHQLTRLESGYHFIRL